MKEYLFTDNDFRFLQKLALKEVGIELGDNKRDLLYGRLIRRLRKMQMDDFASYCKLLQAGDEDELVFFINAITTNLTSLFREEHHFEAMDQYILDEMLKSGRSSLNIWSAGCSSGEEPYTIAMTILDHFNESLPVPVTITATDIDSNKLEECARGVYPISALEQLPHPKFKKYMQRGTGSSEGLVKMKSALKQLIRFRKLNLINRWPLQTKFDIIFCRNVLIYFDEKLQDELVRRFVSMIHPGGYFICGHSEVVANNVECLESLGKTIYKVKGNG